MNYGFSQHVGFYIQEVYRKTTVMLNKALEPYKINYSQFRVLNCLWKSGDLTQKEILAIICVQPSTLTGVIDILVEKGLVVRVGELSDGRLRKITLTQKGLSLKEPTWAVVDVIEAKQTEMMSSENKEMMLTELKKMSKLLGSCHEK